MKPSKVLLVDDQQTILMFEKLLMKSIGAECVTAVNGEEAIEVAERTHPDLILMDINMPILNGIESCARLKKNPLTKNIPIIMVTTKGDEARMKEAEAAGCEGFLTKPIDTAVLLRKIDAIASPPKKAKRKLKPSPQKKVANKQKTRKR